MKKSHLAGVLCAVLFTMMTLSANAAFYGRLPATPGGTDYQAYYDDQLDITWTANANLNGKMNWADANTWAESLTVGGVSGWRLPNMDVNGDDMVECQSGPSTQTVCKDNEYGHLYYYGAGTTRGSGITGANPGPFSNIQAIFSDQYWSSARHPTNRSDALNFSFYNGWSIHLPMTRTTSAWAVYSGDVDNATTKGSCPNHNIPTDPGFFPDSSGKWIDISGSVEVGENGNPVCAMVLANGQYMFSCDGTGSYGLNIPLDNNGQFKLQVYADGFIPTILFFDEFSTNNIVKMTRTTECQ